MKVKCVVVGDESVGKTSMIIAYLTARFLEGSIPSAFNNHLANVLVDGQQVDLELVDTMGHEDYDRNICLNRFLS